METSLTIIWDEGPGENVEHCAEHGVTPEEADEVIIALFPKREPSRRDNGRWVVQGYTSARRFLVVVFEWIEEMGIVIPVTAYEPENKDLIDE